MNTVILSISVLFSGISCKKNETKIPELITLEITNITPGSAVGGGIMLDNGGSQISEKGICWGLSRQPTIYDNIIRDTALKDTFNLNLNGLLPNTIYFVSAFATNSACTGYGSTVSFTTDNGIIDIDGNVYGIVSIGSQDWMLENLRTTHYRNGDTIARRTDAVAWSTGHIGAFCAYNNETAMSNKYGYLYNWYALSDIRGIAPSGWHVPDEDDWAVLANYLIGNGFGYGGSGDDIAKSIAVSSGWMHCDVPGTVGNDQNSNNASGFTGLPSGIRMSDGSFFWEGIYALWWSTTSENANYAWYHEIDSWNSGILTESVEKNWGLSIRCIRD